jgi:hypothetical protein
VKKRRLIQSVIVVIVMVVVLLGFLVVPGLFGMVVLPAQGGLCLLSARYDWNDNSSYSVVFHSVNFTFLYSSYPDPRLRDLPYTAHFVVRFSDGLIENLSLLYNGFGGSSLHGVVTSHSFPRAGVVTGNTDELWGAWRFTVAPWG